MTTENLIKVFEYALNQEKTGMGFFQGSLARMGVGAAVDAFKQLIREEEKHIAFINRILTDLKTPDGIVLRDVERATMEPSNFFDDRAHSEFLEQCVIGSMIPDVTVFNVAWLIEKDLAEFYETAARQTEGPAAEALAMLSAWERGHERFFKQYRDKLTETYSRMPWGG